MLRIYFWTPTFLGSNDPQQIGNSSFAECCFLFCVVLRICTYRYTGVRNNNVLSKKHTEIKTNCVTNGFGLVNSTISLSLLNNSGHVRLLVPDLSQQVLTVSVFSISIIQVKLRLNFHEMSILFKKYNIQK